MPVGLNYEVVLSATGTGSFDLDIQIFEGLEAIEKTTYVNIPVKTENMTAGLTLNGAPSNITVDNEGDGIIDEEYEPIAVLNGEEASDMMPPEIIFNMPSEIVVGSELTIDISVSDADSGVFESVIILDGLVIDNGQNVIINSVGEHKLIVSAIDRAGNPIASEHIITVIYDFIGFLPPIVSSGSYKQGKVLPIKFKLLDDNGNPLPGAIATLSLSKIADGLITSEEVVLSVSNADSGNQFRYDESGEQYIYNLSTENLSPGLWELRVNLDDSKSYFVNLTIKK